MHKYVPRIHIQRLDDEVAAAVAALSASSSLSREVGGDGGNLAATPSAELGAGTSGGGSHADRDHGKTRRSIRLIFLYLIKISPVWNNL